MRRSLSVLALVVGGPGCGDCQVIAVASLEAKDLSIGAGQEVSRSFRVLVAETAAQGSPSLTISRTLPGDEDVAVGVAIDGGAEREEAAAAEPRAYPICTHVEGGEPCEHAVAVSFRSDTEAVMNWQPFASAGSNCCWCEDQVRMEEE